MVSGKLYSVRQASTRTQICTRVLECDKCLVLLLENNWSDSINDAVLRELIYIAQQPWAARYPDHVFESGYQSLKSDGFEDGRIASIALQTIAQEFLFVHRGHVAVRMERFGTWQQGVISRISGLPVIAAARVGQRAIGGHVSGDSPSRLFGERQTQLALPLALPFDPAVEDYISRQGLNESHLHLNGSTHAELCWLRALHRPDREVLEFCQVWKKGRTKHESRKVRELARTNGEAFTPTVLRQHLILARRLRAWLIYAAEGGTSSVTLLPSSAASMLGLRPVLGTPSLPDKYALNRHTSRHQLGAELEWIEKILVYLSHSPVPRLDKMLHLYLLLQHEFRKLLVQSEEQYGFDQFQKFTYTDLRNPAERLYTQRLLDMHGSHGTRSQTAYLEGRFAPKSSVDGNAALIRSILFAYKDYLEEGSDAKGGNKNIGLTQLLSELDTLSEKPECRWPHRQQLALVAHFIKKSWNHNSIKEAGTFRHYTLRRDLERDVSVLRRTLNDYPRVRRWLRGVDGAANELHAPPEVFSSAFRQCERMGLGCKTFHVGEDFPHLLTGIRHMQDALELLNLRNGDRIGHGTAMGIDAGLWLDRMPAELMLRRGDRLLDLLGAWRLLRTLSGESEKAYQIECELSQLLSVVFGEHISTAVFERAMSYRGLHLGFLAALQRNPLWRWEGASLNDSLREEAKLVFEANKSDRRCIELLWSWHSDRKLWGRSEELISVNTQCQLFDTPTYTKLQQALMHEVAARRVVIETLPSSNVRISQYEGFHEHHALRWMQVPGFVKPCDPPIMVSLGSDDPGIFAGDLRGEFYHLFIVLRAQGLSDTDSLNRVAAVNERGRQYRFHDPSL